uniref:Uncharacterized protein n=1 Tax=Caenorhabditis japonica TaxID=281687 RepID=A0A8R1I210_CAEJA
MYGCRCMQKDKTGQLLNSFPSTIPLNSNRPLWKFQQTQEPPSLASNIHRKITYLKQWLASLSLDSSPTAGTTTTRASKKSDPTTVDPLTLPYDEGQKDLFMRFAYKFLANYFKKLRGQWTILDRFECICDGDLVELLNSKTFINIQITHD